MRYQPHFGNEVATLSKLITDLNNSVSIITADIEAEEARVNIGDIADPAYPMLARHLRSRRNNLQATINNLVDRLGAAHPREAEPVAA